MVDMELELVNSCNQAQLPMEGLGTQPNHITIDLQFDLHTRWGEGGKEILGVTNQ